MVDKKFNQECVERFLREQRYWKYLKSKSLSKQALNLGNNHKAIYLEALTLFWRKYQKNSSATPETFFAVCLNNIYSERVRCRTVVAKELDKTIHLDYQISEVQEIDYEQIILDVQRSEFLSRAKETLSERDQLIIDLVRTPTSNGKGYTHREMAQILGVSNSRILQILVRIGETLRKQAQLEGLVDT